MLSGFMDKIYKFQDSNYKSRDTRFKSQISRYQHAPHSLSALRGQKGFTALEMLIVTGIVVILLAVSVASLRDQPVKNRNSERKNEVNNIANALSAWSLDTSTPFGAMSPGLPSTATCLGTKITSPACYDLTQQLIPAYLEKIPEDPKSISGQADTGYTIYKDAATKEIVIGAPKAELGQAIEARRK